MYFTCWVVNVTKAVYRVLKSMNYIKNNLGKLSARKVKFNSWKWGGQQKGDTNETFAKGRWWHPSLPAHLLCDGIWRGDHAAALARGFLLRFHKGLVCHQLQLIVLGEGETWLPLHRSSQLTHYTTKPQYFVARLRLVFVQTIVWQILGHSACQKY